MNQQTAEVLSLAMPAMRIMLNRMGYELLDTLVVQVDGVVCPYRTPALYARSYVENQPHIVIILGDIGWSIEGESACIEYKQWSTDDARPELTEYASGKDMVLYWHWKDPFEYTAIIEESVFWQNS